MSKNKITASLFLITTLGLHNSALTLSDTAYAECYKGKDSEYRYLEYYFVEQPQKLLSDYTKKIKAIGLISITSATIANSYAKLVSTDINLNTIAASLLLLTGFDVHIANKEAEIKYDILSKFLANWDFHKQYIPSSLIPAFDELAAAFNSSEGKIIDTNNVSAIFNVIQHLIEHEFSKRYEKEKKKDVDTLGMFKTVIDINKGLKP